MKLSFDEYCETFKVSKDVLKTKIKNRKVDYIIEDGNIYIINKEMGSTIAPQTQNKTKITIATVLALYEKENRFLKSKISYLEDKIDILVKEKEQLLIEERNKIEQIYNTKDEQLKNILELVNKKIKLQKEELQGSKIENFTNEEFLIVEQNQGEVVELKEYLKSLNLEKEQRKAIKKRFLERYDSDIRIIQKDAKLYLDLNKYDYSDLLDI